MISLGSDHGGFELKKKIMAHLEAKGIPCRDFGCPDGNACDYPDYGRAAAEAVARGECDAGIVVCTTGIGISIVANKVRGIRCAVCTNTYLAKMTRLHNDANMLALGQGVTGEKLAVEIVDTFLETPFSGEGSHIRRIGKIES